MAGSVAVQDKGDTGTIQATELKGHANGFAIDAAEGPEPSSKENKAAANRENTAKKPGRTRKSAPRKPKAKTDYDALPHGLSVTISKEVIDQQSSTENNGEAAPTKTGKLDAPSGQQKKEEEETHAKKPRARKPKNATKTEEGDVAEDKKDAASADGTEAPQAKARKPKTAAQYRVKLGVTPYPELMHPTKEECEIVRELLAKAHPQVKFSQPEAPPIPSRIVAGCGEVPCVLEALIRTYMSSHTSMGNANLAIQGLLKRYPSITTGRAVGSVDWNSVRLNPREDLEVAIRAGGMAPTKSKNIKALLDMVFAENAAMREEIERKRARGSDAPTVAVADDPLPGDPTGVAAMERLADEILTTSPDVLTLDYLHALGAEEAFMQLLPYPGIGVKTAACTLLFCMRRPCFAVDTHVFRLCDTVFAHCDVRVPAAEKYALHQVLIAHGKDCVRCKASSTERTEGWDEAECVIEALVTRTDKKADGSDASPGRKHKRAKEGAEEDEEEDDVADEEAAGQHEDDEAGPADQGSPIKKPRATNGKKSAAKPANSAASETQKPKSVRKRKAPEEEQGDDSADGDFAPLAKAPTKRAAVAKGKSGPKAKTRATPKVNKNATLSEHSAEDEAEDDDEGRVNKPTGASNNSTAKKTLPPRKRTPKVKS